MPLLTSAKKAKLKKKIEGWYCKVRRCPGRVWRAIWMVGHNDPRIAIHSLKVGVALILAALLYFLDPLYKLIGQNAFWAAATIIIVLDFNTGASLFKALNIGVGIVLTMVLALLIQCIAERTSHISRAIFVGFAVFFIGTVCTYVRFIPGLKRHLDLATLFFLISFALVIVSSYRIENIKHVALQRLYSVLIGIGIILIMSLLVFPIWSGEELHKSTISKLEGLSRSIQACVEEYFSEAEEEEESTDNTPPSVVEDPISAGCKAAVNSRARDETLATFASWEPRCSRHWRFPWQQYVKVGTALRLYAYTLVSLYGCLKDEIKSPKCCCAYFRDPCIRVAFEESKALMKLATSMRNQRHCAREIMSEHLQKALLELKIALKSKPRLFLGSSSKSKPVLTSCGSCGGRKDEYSAAATNDAVSTSSSRMADSCGSQRESDQMNHGVFRQLSRISRTSLEFSEALPFAAFAHLLVESVERLDKIIEEVEELGTLAHFKECQPETEYEYDEVLLGIESPRSAAKVDVDEDPPTSMIEGPM